MGFVHLWVRFRTSMWYVLAFILLIGLWVSCNVIWPDVIDNRELTHLNLFISVATELQAVVLLIYVARSREHDATKDKEDKENIRMLLKKLTEMDKKLDD